MRHFFGAGELLPNQKTIKLYSSLLSILCLVSMFSLSAQTPRRDSGADGLIVSALAIGQRVPEDFWTREHLFYSNGDTIRQSLEVYKGKPLLIDFWGTWCVSCVKAFPKLDHLQKSFDGKLNILLVNSTVTKDDFSKIHQMKDESLRNGSLKTIFRDQYFAQLFPFVSIPQYAWINSRGVLEGITGGRLISEQQLEILVNYK